jgi:hypothetical protein
MSYPVGCRQNDNSLFSNVKINMNHDYAYNIECGVLEIVTTQFF